MKQGGPSELGPPGINVRLKPVRLLTLPSVMKDGLAILYTEHAIVDYRVDDYYIGHYRGGGMTIQMPNFLV